MPRASVPLSDRIIALVTLLEIFMRVEATSCLSPKRAVLDSLVKLNLVKKCDDKATWSYMLTLSPL